MNQVSLENYQSSMAPSLWEVYYTAIHMVCINDYSLEQVSAWAPDTYEIKRYQQQMDKLKPIVATIDSKIVGYADLQEDGLIDHFFVHGEYQSKGIGNALMQALLNNGSGLAKLYAHVSFTAKPFFQKHGFIVQSVQEVDVNGCTLQNNIMVRSNQFDEMDTILAKDELDNLSKKNQE